MPCPCNNPPVVCPFPRGTGSHDRTSHSGSRPSAARVDCDRPAYECATLLIEGGNFDAAIARLRQALTSTPRDLNLLNLLGIALTGAGRSEEANSRFREALALDAHFQPARKNLAMNEFNKGRLVPADVCSKKCWRGFRVTTSPISTSARFTTRANSRPWRCRTTKRAASASRPTRCGRSTTRRACSTRAIAPRR